jgi:hypothetical protein
MTSLEGVIEEMNALLLADIKLSDIGMMNA